MAITCKVCDEGALRKSRVYRMSGPVVAIGYIILIPCVLAMMGGCAMMFGSANSAATKPQAVSILDSDAQRLRDAKVPEPIVAGLQVGEKTKDLNLSALSQDQKDQVRMAVEAAQTRHAGADAGRAIGSVVTGGFGFLMVIGSFVGGLLGWLLIMKKTVLRCDNCEATVAAG